MFRDQAEAVLDAFRRGCPVGEGVLRRACDVLDMLVPRFGPMAPALGADLARLEVDTGGRDQAPR